MLNELKSETNPETGMRKRNLSFAAMLIVAFALVWCIGYLTGRMIKDHVMTAGPCTRGYSGQPCRPR